MDYDVAFVSACFVMAWI